MSDVISELDVVEVIALNSSVPIAEIGDIGTVIFVFGDPENPEAYEVECVLENGSNKWEGPFSQNQLKLIEKY